MMSMRLSLHRSEELIPNDEILDAVLNRDQLTKFMAQYE